jgi:UDP-N-acetyl-D-glucosamine dehydrogenase
MKVVIIGQGYVGLNLSIMASKNHMVVGFDINESLVENLNLGKSHIEGITDKDISHAKSLGYRASSNPAELSDAEIVVISVPTPLNEKREPDMSFIESACMNIAKHCQISALIVNESTSYPGTVRNFIKPLIESNQNLLILHSYAVAPERVDPGNQHWNLQNTPRLVAGLDAMATTKVKEFYSEFCVEVREVTSPEVAEAAKLFENTFRQVNIALVNEFAKVTNKLGISVYETLNAADSKPYGFMKFQPSLGVGGHCIPVDPSYLAHIGQQLGVETKFINLANDTNLAMPAYIAQRVCSDLGGTLMGLQIMVLGVSYKPNVADVRETPSAILVSELRKLGAEVCWHDPVVSHWNNEYSAPLARVDAIIIAQMHEAFMSVPLDRYSSYIFDCTGKFPTQHSL